MFNTFFQISLFWVKLSKFSFVVVRKHYRNWGSVDFLCNCNFWFCFFVPKWPFVTMNWFGQSWVFGGLLIPLFLWCFWGDTQFLGPSCQKRFLWTKRAKTWKFCLIIEKRLFWYVLVFLFDFCAISFILVWLYFFGGLKGQVRWSKWPPHLVGCPPKQVFWAGWVGTS